MKAQLNRTSRRTPPALVFALIMLAAAFAVTMLGMLLAYLGT